MKPLPEKLRDVATWLLVRDRVLSPRVVADLLCVAAERIEDLQASLASVSGVVSEAETPASTPTIGASIARAEPAAALQEGGRL